MKRSGPRPKDPEDGGAGFSRQYLKVVTSLVEMVGV